MKQIGTYGQVTVAFIVIGIALMSALGGATFAHTHDRTATAIALLVGAAVLTVYGRRILRWWWSDVMLGLDTPYSEPTREYESTTRAEKLAPKIARMIETAEGPVTVIATGVEPPPTDGAPDAWADALHSAARAGATVRVLLAPGTTAEEAARAHALADTYPGYKVFAIANPGQGEIELFHPTIAWEGDVTQPRQALLWLEDARETDESETSVEFRNTQNLRRNAGMLEEFLESLERGAMRSLGDEHRETSRH